MIKLTTPVGLFGPFDHIETLDDRYRCDGADLPFVVVGQGTIEDAEPGDFPAPAPVKPPVPASITPRQARLALLNAGLLSLVNAALAGLSEPQRSAALIEWEFALSVERDAALVRQLGPALGLNDDQIDDLFIAAAGF